jgi:hypothetical protein
MFSPLGGSRAGLGPVQRIIQLCAVAPLLLASWGSGPSDLPPDPALAGSGGSTAQALHLPVQLDLRTAEGPASGVDALRKRLEIEVRSGGPSALLLALWPTRRTRSLGASRRLDSSLRRADLSVGVLFPYRSTAPPVA